MSAGSEALMFTLGDDEIAVLRHVVAEVHELLQPAEAEEGSSTPEWARDLGLADLDGPPTAPEDPAVLRLLPDGSRDDPMLAGDFRRLTERGLRVTKQEALATTIAVLDRAVDGRVTLAGGEAQAMLRALTDVRLVMAQRLGLETDEDANALHEWIARDADQDDFDDEIDEADDGRMAARWLAHAYDFLTGLQQVLADLLLRDLPIEGEGNRRPPPRTTGDTM